MMLASCLSSKGASTALNIVRRGSSSSTGRSGGLLLRGPAGGSSRTSSSSSAAGAASPRIVISRRVWEAHKKTMPSKPRPSKTKNALDDKPWPRSVQIAAYVAGATLIPYTTVWLILSIDSLREFFGDYLPIDRLRTHFGEVEWDAQSYVDEVDRKRDNIPLDPAYSQLPGEWTYQIRKQQNEIVEMEKTDIPTKMYLILNSTSEQEQPVKYLPGSVRANADTLWELIAGTATTEQKPPDGPIVALDFPDDEAKGGKEEDESRNNVLADFRDGYAEFDSASQQDVAKPLMKKTNTYSSWYYQPQVTTEEAGSQSKQLSQQEMEISHLEFTIERLEKDLKDPTCTRDMDDMMTELRQSKKDLSRLKWKRRLGM